MGNSRKINGIDGPVAGIPARVKSCIGRYVSAGQQMVVALSGGIDSIVLLHANVTLLRATGEKYRLSALHVHHGISQNADHWELFCQAFCDHLGVSFASARVNVECVSKDGLEAAARRARHAVFATVDADWIMLGHHCDDQAETLMFNLLRGTGVNGAGGMRERNGRLLRPLLPVSRGEIEHYARAHCLEWVEDASNADVRYSRNYLRQKIFPELRSRFSAATKNLACAAARFAEAQELLNDLARLDLGADNADFPISVELLKKLSEARARNLLRYLLVRQGGQIPSEPRLREAVRQMLHSAMDRHPGVDIGGFRLLRRRGWIYFEPSPG
jgi:tRNA(Ile)-lysidine synthase